MEKVYSYQSMHTVEVCGTNEGDVNTQVSVIGRAVETKVDTERHRGPGRVLRVAIKAYLIESQKRVIKSGQVGGGVLRTLFAGFCLSFSKIF